MTHNSTCQVRLCSASWYCSLLASGGVISLNNICFLKSILGLQGIRRFCPIVRTRLKEPPAPSPCHSGAWSNLLSFTRLVPVVGSTASVLLSAANHHIPPIIQFKSTATIHHTLACLTALTALAALAILWISRYRMLSIFSPSSFKIRAASAKSFGRDLPIICQQTTLALIS